DRVRRRGAGCGRCGGALRGARAAGASRVLRPQPVARADAELDRRARRTIQHEPHGDGVRRDALPPGAPRSARPAASRVVLYDRALHEPLTETPWDEARVRDAIAAIVADADAAYDLDAFWPAHDWDGYLAALPLKSFYVGAAGVAWALERLGRRGFGSSLDLRDVAARALERFRAEPDFMAGETLPAEKRSSLFHGETGVAFVAWCLAPDEQLEARLLG